MSHVKLSFDIPELIPYLGLEEKYFFGGGRAGVGTFGTDGVWTFLIGPCYTSPNFIKREEISIKVDGKDHKFDMKMKRARRTGSFVGEQHIDGLHIRAVDFTGFDKHWVAKTIYIKNCSQDRSCNINLKALIEPVGTNVHILNGEYVSIVQDTTTQLFSWTYNETVPYNWEDRIANIGFNVPASGVKISDDMYQVETVCHQLDAGKEYIVTFYNFLYFKSSYAQECLKDFLTTDAVKEYACSIDAWDQWLKKGIQYNIPNTRIKDVIEGMLVVLKSCQSYDGGFMACPHCYSFSYFRDSHGALRGLAAAGHTDELRDFIQWAHNKYKSFGHIPNAGEMGGNSSVLNLHLSEENLASESTAYFVFLVKYYYEKTGNLNFIKSVEESWKHAVDVQLHYAEKNNWNLKFNGDETEQYVPAVDGNMYGPLPDWNRSSFGMSSVVMAIASTQFMIRYLDDAGRPEEKILYEAKLTKLKYSVDEKYWLEDKQIHDWTILPDGSRSTYTVTNFNLMPLWMGAKLNQGREVPNVLNMLQYINPETGFLPIAPGGNEGFTGHTMAYLLYDLAKLNHEKMHEVFQTLMSSTIIGAWGSVSEFYGPHGVENSHSMNIFSTGINLCAILYYLFGIEPDAPAGYLKMNPHLPEVWKGASIENYKLGGKVMQIKF